MCTPKLSKTQELRNQYASFRPTNSRDNNNFVLVIAIIFLRIKVVELIGLRIQANTKTRGERW